MGAARSDIASPTLIPVKGTVFPPLETAKDLVGNLSSKTVPYFRTLMAAGPVLVMAAVTLRSLIEETLGDVVESSTLSESISALFSKGDARARVANERTSERRRVEGYIVPGNLAGLKVEEGVQGLLYRSNNQEDRTRRNLPQTPVEESKATPRMIILTGWSDASYSHLIGPRPCAKDKMNLATSRIRSS